MDAGVRRSGAVAAIAFPILQMVAQGLVQVGGGEPAFVAPSSEIVDFFERRDATLFAIGSYVSALSTVPFLWFVAVLWVELREAEGGAALLSMVAFASGIVAGVGYLGSGDWALAVLRIEEGLDPQVARLSFDAGNFAFANLWIALGSMVLAAGLVFSRSTIYPRWLGPSSLALAGSLLLARAFWTVSIALLPYVLFWLWMIALGVVLLRRVGGSARTRETIG